MLENLHDSVYFLDLDHRITFWNKAAERVTGFSRDAVVGSRCSDNVLVHLDDNGHHLCTNGCPAAKTTVDGKQREALVYFRHRDGHRVPVRTRVLPLRDARGEIVGAYEVFREATSDTEREARITELERMAMYDELTQMPNRRYLESRLQARFEDFEQHGWTMGVLLADLDRFKKVNDTWGHDVGDSVLRTVASTLANGVRGGDVIGRWGGEEFRAVIANIDVEGMMTISNRLCSLVRFTNTPGPEGPLTVTLSVGGALIRPGDDIAQVIKRADDALYRGKESGRDRFVLEP